MAYSTKFKYFRSSMAESSLSVQHCRTRGQTSAVVQALEKGDCSHSFASEGRVTDCPPAWGGSLPHLKFGRVSYHSQAQTGSPHPQPSQLCPPHLSVSGSHPLQPGIISGIFVFGLTPTWLLCCWGGLYITSAFCEKSESNTQLLSGQLHQGHRGADGKCKHLKAKSPG